ncbi:MAG: type I secretion system permease/ATPase [Porticoccaceae bacterium]|nr:type I secretion system permease/ATPase [Porticoccaceae bacterium]
MVKPLSKNDLQQALRLCKGSFISAGVFSMFINLLMLVPAFYMMQTYDRVISSGSHTTLLMLTLIMVFLLVTMGGLEWVRSRVLVRTSSKLDSLLTDRMFDTSFKQSLYSGGTVSNAQPLQDLNGIRQFMTGNGFFAFFDAPWLPIYILVMFMFSPWYGFIAILSAIILITIAVFNERTTAHLFEEAAKHQGQAQNMAATNLRNAEVIESMGMLANIRNRWRGYSSQSLYWQSIASDKSAGYTTGSKVFRLTLQSLILGVGAILVLDNQVSPGAMIAGSILLGRALAPIDLLIGSWKQFVTARTQYDRLNKLLDQLPPETEKMSLPEPKGALRLEQAMIGPPLSKTPVVKGVSFAVSPGEAVAIIGPSASGKSTLARGILGIWPAMSGKVRLDGADINHYNREEIGPFLGYLPQDIELFDGTVSENIARFGEVDANKVVAAAQAAGVHDLILQLPNGYDTHIGQGGGALSGGQRQRIGLARALYGDPVLVVLDEPNSNLDDQGELALARCLQGLKERGATTILITHRPSILNLVDKVMVLTDGKIAMFDTREKVLEAMKSGQSQARRQVPVPGIQTNITPISKD